MNHTDLMRHLEESCKFAGEALDKDLPVDKAVRTRVREHVSPLSGTPTDKVQTEPNDTHADKEVSQIARTCIITQVSVTVINLE